MEHLNESSISDLYGSTVRAFPRTTRRQYATQPIIVEELSWTPFLGMKTLFVKSAVRNEDRHYAPIILFKNMNYDGRGAKIKDGNGQLYEFDPISLENTDIVLRCNCADFHWRFNYYNHLDHSLYGRKRTKYESLGLGPPANPLELPGMCKHLIKTIQILKEHQIFVG